MNERLDRLLSARRDGALDSALDEALNGAPDGASEGAERSELERLLAASDDARRRAIEFEDVDASLRRLAAEAIPEERLGRSYSALVGRLGASGETGTRRHLVSIRRVSRRRLLGWGIAAAAALWVASLVIPRGDESAGDLASLGLAEAGDLEVIEELELLEFLAARDRQAEGPRG